jgi:hypothetical protein
VIRGMFHACLIQQERDTRVDGERACHDAHERARLEFPKLLLRLQEKGWKTEDQVTNIEGSTAQRLSIEA